MTGKKILIADDEKTILEAGRVFFEGRGYQVLMAENGAKAVMLVKEEKPDFALLDIVMPEKDGFEACREIKEDTETMDTVVIIFSGSVPEVEKGFDYGADDCILKPLDWGKLVERMEELAENKCEKTG